MTDETHSIQERQQRRGVVVLGLIAVLLLGLCGRVVYIQVGMGPDLVHAAEAQQKSRSVIPSRRGMILDSSGRTVATSRQVPDVFVDPSLIDDVNGLSEQLAVRLGLNPLTLAERINNSKDKRYLVIARGVGEVEADAIRALGQPAVGLSDRAVRYYPLGESMAHVLGFVGRDGHGLEGAELAFNRHLEGEAGQRATVRDVRGRALRRSDSGGQPPRDGGHVVLTIDAEIQRITEKALAEQVQAFEAQSGVAIVMAPESGAVLAMACSPTFDANLASSTPERLRRNRAVTDPVEPGSTFKPFVAAAALAGGFVGLEEEIYCHQGVHRFGRRVVRDTSPQGWLTLKGIVTHSSNIGMGIIAERMGPRALESAIRRFGFGRRTGVGIPGDGKGIVVPLDRWSPLSPASIAMGYEVAVTPLQLITAFSSIVNGGLLVRPRIVEALLGPDGQVVSRIAEAEPAPRVLSPEVARYMTEVVLVSVVQNGGARRAASQRYQVLGKTGTAELTYTDRPGYEPGAYLSSFIGAAPASDPRLTVVVMIRRPDPALGHYGSEVAAPAVGRILEQALTYMGVEPDKSKSTFGTAAR